MSRAVILSLAVVLASCAGKQRPPAAPASTPTTRAPQSATVDMRLLAFNDVHGHLEPEAAGGKPRYGHGGVLGLAREIRARRTTHSFVLSAGDLFGASPLLSSMFDHAPTVAAMNALGLDISALGNHEFDRGVPALRTALTAAKFEVLGANVFANGERAFAPYSLRDVDGIPVAFIGLTTKDTRTLVIGERIKGYSFADETETVNAVVAELQPKGVQAFVVLIHEGGTHHGGLNDCNNLKGPIVEIAAGVSPAVDVIVSGHTHQAYNCVLSGKRVTSALSYARMLTQIDLKLDRVTRDIKDVDAHNVVVDDGAADPAVATALAPFVDRAKPVLEKVVGRVTATVKTEANADGEAPLGSLAADAQLDATRAAGAQLALVNSGGLRADIPFVSERNGDVRYSEVYAAQPFGNALVTTSITGKALKRAISGAMWDGEGLLQVSANVAIVWADGKIVSMSVDGAAVQDDTTYRVTINEYMAAAAPWKSGKDAVVGITDSDALVKFLGKGVYTPKPGRIVRKR